MTCWLDLSSSCASASCDLAFVHLVRVRAKLKAAVVRGQLETVSLGLG